MHVYCLRKAFLCRIVVDETSETRAYMGLFWKGSSIGPSWDIYIYLLRTRLRCCRFFVLFPKLLNLENKIQRVCVCSTVSYLHVGLLESSSFWFRSPFLACRGGTASCRFSLHIVLPRDWKSAQFRSSFVISQRQLRSFSNQIERLTTSLRSK